MIEYFFRYLISTGAGEIETVKDPEGECNALILSAGAYLLSLTMKPTSLIFSTAVFGMMGIYLIGWRRLSFSRIPQALGVHNPAGGGPRRNLGENHDDNRNACDFRFHLHFFAKLGFEMKYPLPQVPCLKTGRMRAIFMCCSAGSGRCFYRRRGRTWGMWIIAWGNLPALFWFCSSLCP